MPFYLWQTIYREREREREREKEREREYNKVQACFVLETFYSEFSPLRALSGPARSYNFLTVNLVFLCVCVCVCVSMCVRVCTRARARVCRRLSHLSVSIYIKNKC